MTREIALHCMKSYSELHSDLCELCPIYGQTGSDHCFEDALQYVIGMLEQEPILNKIRADYENRLKADMVAMLEEIDLEMSEQSFGIQTEPWEVVEKLRKEIIQQKINALKANAEDQDV